MPVGCTPDADGAAFQGDVWRKTVQKTSHGKQLNLLRTKLEQKTSGGANSVLRLFKEFQRQAFSKDHQITLEEFKRCVKHVNLPLSGAHQSLVQACASNALPFR